MIKKDSFIEIVNALQDYWSRLDVLYDELGINMDDNAFTRVFDSVMNALCKDVENDIDDDFGPMLYYYAFECDWGRNEKAREGMLTFGDECMPLTSAAELYDFLQFKNDMDYYTAHTTHGGTWIDEEAKT